MHIPAIAVFEAAFFPEFATSGDCGPATSSPERRDRVGEDISISPKFVIAMPGALSPLRVT